MTRTVTADHSSEGVLFAGEGWRPGEVRIGLGKYTIARPDGTFRVTIRELPAHTQSVVFEQDGEEVEAVVP